MTQISTELTCARQKRHGIWARLQQVRGILRQRRDLVQLSDAQLRDIGLCRAQVEAESRRSVWDVPQHWHS
jgi:uncharacterized protein YjiS (DUF1127 family)